MNSLIKPLFKGECLKDPAFWKGMQNKVNVIGAVLPVAAVFFPGIQVYISADLILKVYSALGAFNLYFTNATSEKVGL
jgi:hypothetical protein